MRGIALAAAAALLALPAAAQEMSGDPAEGQAMAEELCSPCHAIGESGESRNPNAPPFREVVQRYPVSNLEEALAEGILVGHDAPMPQFTFAPEEIDDLLAYLDGLVPR